MNENTVSSENENIGLKKYIVSYIRQWKLFVGVFLFSFIPAILYLVFIPSTYEITAQVQIQADEEGGMSLGLGEAAGLMKSFGLGGGSVGTVSIEDEMTILASNHLLRKVIDSLEMQVQYMKPNMYNYKLYHNSPFILTFDDSTNKNIFDEIIFKVAVSKSGNLQVNVQSEDDGKKYSFNFNSLPATISLDQGDFILNYRHPDQPVAYSKMKIKVLPLTWVAEELAEELQVDDVSKTANIITLTIEDYERKRGVNFLNTLIDLYNKQTISVKKERAQQTLGFVEGRLNDVMRELHQTEMEIETYKKKNKMTELEYDIQLYTTQVESLQRAIIELETQIQVINMMAEFVKDPANKYNLVPTLIDQVGDGGAISLYNQKLMERMQLLRSSQLQQQILTQIDESLGPLRENVFLSISNARDGLRNSINELRRQEKEIFDKMGNVPTMEREFIDYRRQQEVYQGVFLILLQRREDTALTLGDLKDRAIVIDDPYVKQKRVAPRKLYAAIVMMLLTLVFPIAWIESKRLYLQLKEEYKQTK
ncbi:Wzz/FepE/Etk N-terminal domain-containing protein [Parabacteroides sp. PF5-9]|uniref:GumC family protein n=1 Tax=Parabacteroides sp. PF5-9 TaxID=1742404 RepID=UPI0024732FB9|nr:Wzz/FepE/Etk N-terminal domain-containing protein [Parabacteroides sp. PF5-9]MDH6358240.1 tyrosine-protein kinase Etk/Wzc [Parabacteroides sp. PF5-9]